MHLPLLQAFDDLIAERKSLWAKRFIGYFHSHLETDLRTKACRFVISSNVEFDEWSGVTSNAAESMNAVLEREIESPVSMPEALLILFNITKRYDYDIDCGMALTGMVPC
jgi:hypothetical protein